MDERIRDELITTTKNQSPVTYREIPQLENMIQHHKRHAAAKTAHQKTIIQRQIDATDRQIDQLVYKLYNLTDEEIKIIEKASDEC